MVGRARPHGAHRRIDTGRVHRRPRWTGLLAAGTLGAGLVVGLVAPSVAAQASGDDVAVWYPGWSWTYDQTFHYDDGNGTYATVAETVSYTNQGPTVFQGQSAYRVTLSGSITGGSGNASGYALNSFSGSVSGTEYIRRADLALLQEQQTQNLDAKAKVSFLTVGVNADIDLTLAPSPGWRTLDFPLDAGDSWHESEAVDYSGNFSYSGGGGLASGGGPLSGSFPFDATASVAHETVATPAGSLATDRVDAGTADGTSADDQWWAPAVHNLAKEHLQLPLDDAAATLDRTLRSSSTPTPANTITQTVTPSLSCAGGPVTVAGTLSTHASGVPVTITLDRSPASAGQVQTASTTTAAGGVYSATLTAPTGTDGANKNGARGSWGVLVDAGGGTGAGNAATLVVSPQDCTSLVYSGDLAAPTGSPATARATLTDLADPSAAAGRTVVFALSAGGSVSATTNAAGVASAVLPVTGAPRSATVSASLAASAGLAAAADSAPFTVSPDPTTTVVGASALSATVGDPVTFTATVTPGIGAGPTGTAQFVVDGQDFGPPVPLTGGQATSAPISTLAVGPHTVLASYSGDTTFAPSTAATITVRVHDPLPPTTTTLAVQPAGSVHGQTVTLTATVAPRTGAGTPTGTVTFTDGGTPLGTATVTGGQAGLEIADLGVGNHAIVARYSGDDAYDGSDSAPSPYSVAKADTTAVLGSSGASSVSGEAVTYSVTVAAQAPGAGTPGGTVRLQVDGADAGGLVPLAAGAATFAPITSLSAGTHSVAVTYSGDANFTGSTDALTQHVAPAGTSTHLASNRNPANEGDEITLTATVAATAPGSGDPTGTVAFTSDGDPIGAATVTPTADGDRASITVDSLSVGSHLIAAHYAGDADYSASDADDFSQTVVAGSAIVATDVALDSSLNPSTFGQLISFTATVTAAGTQAGTPTGQVQFTVDGTPVGPLVDVDGDGRATSAYLASPEPGDHTVGAEFRPAAGFAGSGALLTQTVEDAGVTVHLSSASPSTDYGQPVSFAVTVESDQIGTGTPTGAVQFTVDGQPLGDAVTLDDGAAQSASVATLAPGAHQIGVVYSGDADFVGGTDALSQTVRPPASTTTLASDRNPSTFGQPVTFTATVTPATDSLGAPDGTVTFRDGDSVLGTVPVAASGSTGRAGVTVTTLGGGPHPITATYSGSTGFAGSASAVLHQQVDRAAVTLRADAAAVQLSPLGLPLGQLHVTLASGGAPLAGAPIVFTIGGKVACTPLTGADGGATCNGLPKLLNLVLAGGYQASYAGDANHLPATATGALIK